MEVVHDGPINNTATPTIEDETVNEIIDYWFNGGPDLWFQSNQTIRNSIDSFLCDKYRELIRYLEKLFDINSTILQTKKEFTSNLKMVTCIVIILDQFSRHIYRNSDNDRITKNTFTASHVSSFFLQNYSQRFENGELKYLAFLLMPFKHIDIHNNWHFICEQITKYDYTSCSVLYRFYKDSISKYSLEQNTHSIEKQRESSDHLASCDKFDDFRDITDFLPEKFLNIRAIFDEALHDMNHNYTSYKPKHCHPIFNEIRNFITFLSKQQNVEKPTITISISGGVDSMVTTFVLALLSRHLNTFCLQAVHLNYMNRKVSTRESNFVVWYCTQLDVPIFLRTINEIQRGDGKRSKNAVGENIVVDENLAGENVADDREPDKSGNRDFYETLTRNIRFDLYAKLPKPQKQNNSFVVLGHNHDDIVENIWTNFAKGNFIFNLKKMENIDMQENVLILRPLLNTKKDLIYEFSKLFHIAYLKNTTPNWSVRGKMRNAFLPTVDSIFGNQVNIEYVADTLGEYGKCIEKTLFNPILKNVIYHETHNQDNSLFCSVPFEKFHIELGTHFWGSVLGTILRKAGVGDPTRKSIDKFVCDLRKSYEHNGKNQKKINIKKGVWILLDKTQALHIHIQK